MTTIVRTHDGPSGRYVPKGKKGELRKLHWYLSLAGDDEARISPLNRIDDAPIVANRYEWAVGAICCADPATWWDWEGALRDEDAIKVQVLIRVPQSVAWSELDAQLLALRPSRNTRSWLEENSARALDVLKSVSAVAQGALPGYAKYPLALLNAVPSEAAQMVPGHVKNWFLYRYFDAQTLRTGLEWTISSAVVREYGPLLRGTVDIVYHGAVAENDAEVEIGMRVGAGFQGQFQLEYARPDMGDAPDPRLELHARIAAKLRVLQGRSARPTLLSAQG